MTWKRRGPAGGNGRASEELSKADGIAGSQDRPYRWLVQPSLPSGFDPVAMPILARHWFGIVPDLHTAVTTSVAASDVALR